MGQSGQINMKQVIATYTINDTHLVDSRELSLAFEFQLTYEISFAIGLTLLGNLISNFNWPLLATAGVFLLFGIIFLIRYIRKFKELNRPAKSNAIQSS